MKKSKKAKTRQLDIFKNPDFQKKQIEPVMGEIWRVVKEIQRFQDNYQYAGNDFAWWRSRFQNYQGLASTTIPKNKWLKIEMNEDLFRLIWNLYENEICRMPYDRRY